MKLRICAVGRLRAGAEAALVDDYLGRFARTGAQVGLGPAAVTEVEAKRGGQLEEAKLLSRAAAGCGAVLALDERGAALGSVAFARVLTDLRDDGHATCAILIGGADGLTPPVRNGARRVISLGPMVWPHKLVRVMLAEQLYRAASIAAGLPYHRD